MKNRSCIIKPFKVSRIICQNFKRDEKKFCFVRKCTEDVFCIFFTAILFVEFLIVKMKKKFTTISKYIKKYIKELDIISYRIHTLIT